MSRAWLAIYTAMVTKPKYRKLSPAGRGALLHTLVLACYQDPEATWDDPEELREALRLDGFPDDVFEELIGLRWLDLEDGVLRIHGWDKHQLAASAAIGKAWEAANKQEWRRKKERTKERGQDITRHNNSPDMSRHVPTLSTDLSSKEPAMRPDQIPPSKNVVKAENGLGPYQVAGNVPTSTDTSQTDDQPSVKKRPRSRPVTRDASTPTALGAALPAEIQIGDALFLEGDAWNPEPTE